MQQVIYLEKDDLVSIKAGRTIVLNIGGATVTVGYMGARYKPAELLSDQAPAVARGPYKKRPWNKGLKGVLPPRKKSPCRICGKRCNVQGMAPHMRMHERKGEVK